MANNSSGSNQAAITYEEKRGSKWVPLKFNLRDSVNVGAVLREMKAQPVIRNVQLTKG